MKKILICDDSIAEVKLMQSVLEKAGYWPVVTHDAMQVDLPLRRFVLGLTLGSLVFLTLHFFLGYLGGSALSVIGRVLPLPIVLMLVLALLVIVYVIWVSALRRQKAARAELEAMQTEQNDAAALEVWHEGMCPVCLTL